MRLLKRHRIAAGFTQIDLAKKLGVDQSTVSLWESGEYLPQPHLIPKLARFLGLSPMDLTRVLDPETRDEESLVSNKAISAS